MKLRLNRNLVGILFHITRRHPVPLSQEYKDRVDFLKKQDSLTQEEDDNFQIYQITQICSIYFICYITKDIIKYSSLTLIKYGICKEPTLLPFGKSTHLRLPFNKSITFIWVIGLYSHRNQLTRNIATKYKIIFFWNERE